MKGSTLLILGAIGVGLYLNSKSKQTTSSDSTFGGSPQDIPSGTTSVKVSAYSEDSGKNGSKMTPAIVSVVVPLNPINTPQENMSIVKQTQTLISKGQTTPTPTSKPSGVSVKTTSSISKSTGIKVVTNTMPVTQSVTNALRGTISPLTGKLRI
jgi:hypothetical protein